MDALITIGVSLFIFAAAACLAMIFAIVLLDYKREKRKEENKSMCDDEQNKEALTKICANCKYFDGIQYFDNEQKNRCKIVNGAVFNKYCKFFEAEE